MSQEDGCEFQSTGSALSLIRDDVEEQDRGTSTNEAAVLPHEVLEKIVMKAVIVLFAIYRVRLLSRADILTLVTICSVCREWYEVYSSRSSIRRKLGRCLKGKMFDMPIALRKAAVMFRKLLAEEPVSMRVSNRGDCYSISRKPVDAQALIVMSSVCLYWSRIFSSCNRRSRQQLRRSFNTMPQLTQVVFLHHDRRHVVGLTSVDSRRLFVLRWPSKQCIQVYKTTTFKLQQTLHVRDLYIHLDSDLTSCVVNNCLYVSVIARDVFVYKIGLTGDNQVLKWRIEGRWPFQLSVNTACNLLVSCLEDSKLLEYTSSGSLVREIKLESMMYPRHAIQLASDRFVVCMVSKSKPDDLIPNRDVVEMNSRGQVVVSYKNQLQSTTRHQFNFPCHLAVDRNNECIFVADDNNDRIVMLSRSLKCAREFKASVDGSRLRSPHHLHLNQSNSRLYVSGGQMFVFDIPRCF